ncbi:hypothetical protein RhiJN_16430 [Ceratobasidium sp. AG-Ba]|nr:hypothetical protein RhiJN_16430 [Ceratobasidium sp. AG-Ba]
MTSVHGTPEPDGSENGDPVPQLEVWATLNKTVQVTTSNRTRNTTKTVKSTDTRVIFVPIEDLTFGGFMSVVLADFKFSTEMPEGSTLPFTYYHKGRPKANAASVESDKDFDTMIRVLDSKQLKLVNIGFEDSDVKKALGNAPISGVNDTGSSGLAEHNGIPNVTVMSQLERQRATITQKLEDKWRCLDHSGACYVKDKIHERLTPFRLSIWSNHIYEHTATLSEPPKVAAFSFIYDSEKPKPSKADSLVASTPSSDLAASTISLLGSIFGSGRNLNPLVPPGLNSNLPSLNSNPGTDPALDKFLEFASKEFSVQIDTYRGVLQRERIGPDVITELPDLKDLTSLGVPLGDAHRLRQAAKRWQSDQEYPNKRQRHDQSPSETPYTLGFPEPEPPSPGHKRTEAERAGRPYPGTKGAIRWEEHFADGGMRSFWANLPSPTLNPQDPLLARPGTVVMAAGNDRYLEVVRAPRYDITQIEEGQELDELVDNVGR